MSRVAGGGALTTLRQRAAAHRIRIMVVAAEIVVFTALVTVARGWWLFCGLVAMWFILAAETGARRADRRRRSAAPGVDDVR